MESEGLLLVELSGLVINLSRKNSLVGVIELLLFMLILELKPLIAYLSAPISEDGFFSGTPGSEFSIMGVAVRSFSSFNPVSFSVSPGTLSSPFSTSDSGLWVLGSMPLCFSFFLMHEFHRFLISLSVLPGNCAAI